MADEDKPQRIKEINERRDALRNLIQKIEAEDAIKKDRPVTDESDDMMAIANYQQKEKNDKSRRFLLDRKADLANLDDLVRSLEKTN